MREANLKATVRRPKTTKESKGKAAGHVYGNLLNQDFQASHPNQKWVTDMTGVLWRIRSIIFQRWWIYLTESYLLYKLAPIQTRNLLNPL